MPVKFITKGEPSSFFVLATNEFDSEFSIILSDSKEFCTTFLQLLFWDVIFIYIKLFVDGYQVILFY